MQKSGYVVPAVRLARHVNDVVDKLIREQSASGQRKKQLTIF